jgi:hypothetical protein
MKHHAKKIPLNHNLKQLGTASSPNVTELAQERLHLSLVDGNPNWTVVLVTSVSTTRFDLHQKV